MNRLGLHCIHSVFCSLTVLPGCQQATAKADTSREMVTGTLARVGSWSTEPSGQDQDPQPDTPTAFSKQSSYADDVPQSTRRPSADKPGIRESRILCPVWC